MAIRIQNLPKKGFDQGSALSMPHFGINYPPWCVTGKHQMPLSLFNNNNNVTAKSESPSQNNPEVKPLGFQLMEQDSSSTQSLGNSHSSHQDISAAEGVNSQDLSVSPESGQDESCGRSVDSQMKPVFLYSNESDFMFNPSQADHGHPMVHVPYAPADPYLGGLMTTYGPQAIIQPQMGNQIIGMAPNRVPLPLNLAEDGPIYVNAKQYHGILRRRQSRAKLEAQNKLVKTRKPYLHESRHLHALKRVRGSGGRFLSTKKLQQANLTSQQKDGSGQDSHQIRGNDRFAPSTTCSDVKSVSNRDSLFLQSERGISGFSGAMGSAGQLNGDLLFGASGHRSSSVR